MINKVEICGVNTSKLPLLKENEMVSLMAEVKKGNKQARADFITGNLRLVLSVVQKFGNRGENPDDLFQIGCIGLIKALDNFDTSHGVKFSTYAVPMIIGEIRRYLRDNNSIKVSRSLRDLAYKALQVREQLTRKNHNEPKISEIAKILEVPPEDVIAALDSIQEPISLFDQVFQNNGDSVFIMDQVKDTKNTEEKWTENIALDDAMKRLNDREKHILTRRFFDGKTQMEVADEIGISQAQVSRLEKNALAGMRSYMG